MCTFGIILNEVADGKIIIAAIIENVVNSLVDRNLFYSYLYSITSPPTIFFVCQL